VLVYDKRCLLAIVFTLHRADHKTSPHHPFFWCNYLFHGFKVTFLNLEKVFYLALVLREKYFLAKALHLTFEIPSGCDCSNALSTDKVHTKINGTLKSVKRTVRHKGIAGVT